MRNLPAILLSLTLLAATQSCTQSLTVNLPAPRPAQLASPHSQALALVLATQQSAIRDLETSAGSLTIAGPDLTGLALLLSHGKQQKLSPAQYRLAVDLDQLNNPNDPTPTTPYWIDKISTDPIAFEITK